MRGSESDLRGPAWRKFTEFFPGTSEPTRIITSYLLKYSHRDSLKKDVKRGTISPAWNISPPWKKSVKARLSDYCENGSWRIILWCGGDVLRVTFLFVDLLGKCQRQTCFTLRMSSKSTKYHNHYDYECHHHSLYSTTSVKTTNTTTRATTVSPPLDLESTRVR